MSNAGVDSLHNLESRTIILFTGLPASGKDYIGDWLTRDFGIQKRTVSDVLRSEAERRGIQGPTRQQLVDISRELSDSTGDSAVLVKMLLEQVPDSVMTLVGTAQLGQILFLRNRIKQLIHIELVASLEVRYHRALRRAREEGKGLTLAEFQMREIRENTEGNMWEVLQKGIEEHHAIERGEIAREKVMLNLLSRQNRFTVGNLAEYQIWDDGRVLQNHFWNTRKDDDDRWTEIISSEKSPHFWPMYRILRAKFGIPSSRKNTESNVLSILQDRGVPIAPISSQKATTKVG